MGNDSQAAKTKKCRACRQNFVPLRPLQTACSPVCAIDLAKKAKAKQVAAREREQRRLTKARKQALETLPELTKKAQVAFNRYIRLRDAGLPCISCGKPHDGNPNSFDAGHYRSVGSSPSLRFNEDNVHAQCKYCNCHLSGNVVAYRIGLTKRIGIERVEALECDHVVRKYSKDDLRDLAALYKHKAAGLK